MTVLVTGGTGFIGRALTSRLVADGHDVRVLARRAGETRGVRRYAGSILDPEALAAACSGCDAVVHLVGIISEGGRQTFERIHDQGTADVIQAAAAAGVRRFLQMSALGARPNAPSKYHQTKWSAEERVRASRLEWTIFRPSLVYGPGDGFVSLHLRIARWSPVVPLLGGGRTRFQPVTVDDVARAFACALTQTRSVGKTYTLAGPSPIEYRAMAADILRAAGLRRLLLPAPAWTAWPGALAGELLLGGLLGLPPLLNRSQLIMLGEDNVGDPGPAARDFGFAPRPWPEGLAAMFQVVNRT